jgi:hypothetical protein
MGLHATIYIYDKIFVVVCYVVFVFVGGHIIVDFSLNFVYICYKCHNVDIFVYLTHGMTTQKYLPPGLFFKDSWYSFLLEAESTPGP